jgi:hypothetical protein
VYANALPGGERNQKILELLAETGLDPRGEGRIEFSWGAYLGVSSGAVCRSPKIPSRIRMAISTRSGSPSVASFLRELGIALHLAYTDPSLPVEQRRLGDEAVTLASGLLLESLLREVSFLSRAFSLPRHRAADFVRLQTFVSLYRSRRDVGILRYELARFEGGAGPESYEDLLREATGFRHDARAAGWEIDGEFGSARRIRATQLAGVLGAVLRSRFDEDWFRNPATGGFLRDLFGKGRRYSARELAVQMGFDASGYGAYLSTLR